MAKTWKDRLVKEANKLEERLDELTSFVEGNHGKFNELKEPDRDLLVTQHAIMTSYLNLLTMRMKRLGLLKCEDCKKGKPVGDFGDFINALFNDVKVKAHEAKGEEEDGRNS